MYFGAAGQIITDAFTVASIADRGYYGGPLARPGSSALGAVGRRCGSLAGANAEQIYRLELQNCKETSQY